MDFVVERYGDYVLLKPRLTAQTLVLWGTPLSCWSSPPACCLLRRRGQSAAPERPLSEAERQALKKALSSAEPHYERFTWPKCRCKVADLSSSSLETYQ